MTTQMNKPLSIEQIETMVRLQCNLNSKINPEWLTANYDWKLATFMEVAEAIESAPSWEWWKTPTPANMSNLKTEMVDIGHFLISLNVVDFASNIGEDKMSERIIRGVIRGVSNNILILQRQARHALVNGLHANLRETGYCTPTAFASLFAAAQVIDFGFQEFYQVFLGKNILNMYRSDHGYKDPNVSYMKVFPDGREDNDVFKDLLVEVDNIDELSFDELKEVMYEKMDWMVKTCNYI